MQEIKIRLAEELDVESVCATDEIGSREVTRQIFIKKSISERNLYVAILKEQIIGYSVIEHTFFSRGFISMLMVMQDYRRMGVGSLLIKHMESLCQSERIFTSTNESNSIMRACLKKMGYVESGMVKDLDPGDPEIFYSKSLR